MMTPDAEWPIVDSMQPLGAYRSELTRHAARVLGSAFEAEDAVQETMVRAWSALDRFEGRAELRTWLYRICTNLCIDMLASRQRRARPGLEPSQSERALAPVGSTTGLRPDGDPADVTVARESVRLVLTAVLQYLPPRQRAVLILREVLHWRATEIAELLSTSVASVNSALQRARATLRSDPVARGTSRPTEVDTETRSRLNRYADALASSDVLFLIALVADEGTWITRVRPSGNSQ